MFSDIFANIAIVVSFLFLIGQIIKDYPLDNRLQFREQVILGIIYSALVIALLSYTIHATDTVIFDLRNLSIISAGIIGGPITIAITSLSAAAFRLLFFGINTASMTAVFVAIVIGIVCIYISQINISRYKKFIYMFLFSMLVSNGAFIYLIKDVGKLIETLSFYWPVYLFGAVVAYYALEYIISANENFRSMAYYRMVADNQRDMLSTHRHDGTYIYVSPSSVHLLGYAPDELIRLNTFDIIHPDDVKAIKECFWNLFNGLDTSTQTYRVKTSSEKYIWVESSVRCVRNKDGALKEIINTTRDITLRKQIEQQLKISNAKFKAIFQNAGIGIIMRDSDGKAIEANPAYLAMIGYTKEEIYNLEDVIHPEDLNNELKYFNELVSGNCSSYRSEVRYINKVGEKLYADVTSTLVPGTTGSPTSVIRVVNDITFRKQAEEELKRAKQKAEEAASIDYLTGVLNRRAFINRFSEEFSRALREKNSISLIMADIDHFKRINDTYGHQIGDLALQKFSRCLSDVCRPYDFIGRHGGEEFIICLPTTSCEQASLVAERMRSAVEKMTIDLEDENKSIRITASFGISSPINGSEENMEELINLADKAMYKAKVSGRNRVCIACGKLSDETAII